MLRQRVQGMVQYRSNLIEADLQEHLGPNPLYLEFDLLKPRVHANLQVHQARELRQDRDVRPEAPDGQADPVYLQLRDVQEHVDVLAGRGLFWDAVVGWLWILGHEMYLLAVHVPSHENPGTVCFPCTKDMMPPSATPRHLRKISLPRTRVNKDWGEAPRPNGLFSLEAAATFGP